MEQPEEVLVTMPINAVSLEGALGIPTGARGVVLFAHGSGSSRLSPRNNFIARALRQAGIGTLLFDLLTAEEDVEHSRRFDIDLLTERLLAATRWLRDQQGARELAFGYFGASTGSAAALNAAAEMGAIIRAVVSRGGRPDLAEGALPRVQSPTLLIVGGHDDIVVDLNRHAYELLQTTRELAIVPGATHLFEEPGAMEQVAVLATDWFRRYLGEEARKAA